MSNALARKPLRGQLLALGLTVLLVLIVTTTGHTARRISRPITTLGGRLDQTYLYGELFNGWVHKGVDLTYGIGTNVYAVAAGRVVDMRDNWPEGNQTTAFGNYVLIRHDKRHYDRPSGQWAYVYSMYLHLDQWSVTDAGVAEQDLVAEGQWIGQVDTTGRATGPHLHLQIVVHPLSDRVLEPTNTLESEDRSRNPELWLTPYNYSGANTATLVGKVTGSSGGAVHNKIICFGNPPPAEKPYSSLDFEWSRTYSYPALDPDEQLNSDDYLLENFATTDVTPGTYHLYAYEYGNEDTNCGDTVLYRDLGNYTFTAGQTTYVGLYPVWLPFVKHGFSNWNSTIFVRNNSSSKTTIITTTYFDTYGTVRQQSANTIQPNRFAILTPPTSFNGSALVSSSEDIAVMVEMKYTGAYAGIAGYNGLTPSAANGGEGSPGWEQVGHTLYIPLAKKNWYGRWSEIVVVNAGTQPTRVYAYFTRSNGTQACIQEETVLEPNERRTFTPSSCSSDSSQYYAVRVISLSLQPLAAVVLEGDTSSPDDRPAVYNASSSGFGTLLSPMVKKKYYGHTTGMTVQHVDDTFYSLGLTINYHNMNGFGVAELYRDDIEPDAPEVIVDPPELSDGFLGSAHLYVIGEYHIVGQMTESNEYLGGSRRMMSNLPLKTGATKTIILPLWYERYLSSGADWRSGVNVRNAGSGSTNVTAYWYSQFGTLVYNQTISLVNSNDTHTFHDIAGLTDGSRYSLKLVSASQPIVAISNVHNYAVGASGDITMAVNGSNR